MAKLLFIHYKKSGNILEGGEQCTSRNRSALAEILGGDNINSYHIHEDNEKKSLLTMIGSGILSIFNYYYGLSPRRVKKIVAMAMEYDYVFIDRSVFGIIAKALKKNGYKGKIITFFHNVEVPYFKAKLSHNWLARLFLLGCIDSNDKYSCQYSDRLIVLNERDRNEIKTRYGRLAESVIPISLDDKCPNKPQIQEMTSEKPLCMFLGSYFPPNNEGIIWFAKNVLPHASIRMKIVGKGMAQLRNDEPELLKNIEIVSDAPDLQPYFAEADIMVLPIFSGSGMKVKTCESLMHGKNIIGTTEAFEGYDVDTKKVGGECNTAEEFIALLNDFAQNPRPKFNEHSRNAFLKNYSEDAVIEKFRGIFSENSMSN